MWYKDIFRESFYIGKFNIYIQVCLKLGIALFILREFIFFFTFFWSYFHYIFMSQGEFSFRWPPLYISKINHIGLPLFNTLLLLTRGISLTLAHNFILFNKNFNFYLNRTILLGVIFIRGQFWEFYMSDYLISNSSYGSIFFIGTGFHGFHVRLGTLLLLISAYISKTIYLNNIFFEIRAWYWHFVDVIWLFLYTEFYWWVNFL